MYIENNVAYYNIIAQYYSSAYDKDLKLSGHLFSYYTLIDFSIDNVYIVNLSGQI